MAERSRSILICSCEDTIPLDAEAVRRVCRDSVVIAGRQFCRSELERFRKAAAAGEQITVACTQEAPRFDEIADEIEGSGALTFVNIRETAGWSKDAADAGPKMAALIAASASPFRKLHSCRWPAMASRFFMGQTSATIEAANLLKDHLDITVLIKPNAEIATAPGNRIPRGEGHHPRGQRLSRRIRDSSIDDYATSSLSRVAPWNSAHSRDGATSRCDILVDLSGGPPLVCRGRFCAMATCAPIQ